MLSTGVNYPWRHYGGDFGPTLWGSHHGIVSASTAIAADLRELAAAGVEAVRWFVFTDARGGLDIDAQGWPAGFRDGTLADLDALCALALAAGVRLVPVLFDHTLAFHPTPVAGVVVGGHRAWLADPEGQSRLLEAVIAPLARRYGRGGTQARLGEAVLAWDLLNEPDWLVTELYPSRRVEPMPFDVLAAWLRDAAGELHRAGAGAVTVGGARLRFASWWDDPRLGLDFLQTHAYYDPAHDLDVLRTLAGRARVDAPRRGRGVLRARRRRRRGGGTSAARRSGAGRADSGRGLRRRVAVELARRGWARGHRRRGDAGDQCGHRPSPGRPRPQRTMTAGASGASPLSPS